MTDQNYTHFSMVMSPGEHSGQLISKSFIRLPDSLGLAILSENTEVLDIPCVFPAGTEPPEAVRIMLCRYSTHDDHLWRHIGAALRLRPLGEPRLWHMFRTLRREEREAYPLPGERAEPPRAPAGPGTARAEHAVMIQFIDELGRSDISAERQKANWLAFADILSDIPWGYVPNGDCGIYTEMHNFVEIIRRRLRNDTSPAPEKASDYNGGQMYAVGSPSLRDENPNVTLPNDDRNVVDDGIVTLGPFERAMDEVIAEMKQTYALDWARAFIETCKRLEIPSYPEVWLNNWFARAMMAAAARMQSEDSPPEEITR